jgi:hypothetical protein
VIRRKRKVVIKCDQLFVGQREKEVPRYRSAASLLPRRPIVKTPPFLNPAPIHANAGLRDRFWLVSAKLDWRLNP